MQVFARCVHGRREGWTSVFASDAEVSLDDGLPIPDDVDGDDDEDDEDGRRLRRLSPEAGELDRRSGFAGLTGPSLVITRSTPEGVERLCRSYALRGLLWRPC